MTISAFLGLMGGVLLLGVLGNYFFSKIRIPNPVTLTLMGIIFGPLTGLLDGAHFQAAAPYFGTIALIIILFEGGLEIDIHSALGQARDAFILGTVYFLLCTSVVFLVCILLLRLEPLVALLYGVVLGGTSPAVILPIITSLKASKNISALFTMEAIVAEVLTVVSTVLILGYAKAESATNSLSTIYYIFHVFWVALVIALLAGWAWTWMMGVIERAGVSQMLTLAFLFLLYAIASVFHAEPAVTILLFGLILENGHYLSSRLMPFLPSFLRPLFTFPVLEKKHLFSNIVTELSLLIRTFFFFLVGLLVNVSGMRTSEWIAALLFLAYFIFFRAFVMRLLSKFKPDLEPSTQTIGDLMIPRGLATAVMALMVDAAGIPNTKTLVPISFFIIISTNLAMAAQFIFRWKSINASATAAPLEHKATIPTPD